MKSSSSQSKDNHSTEDSNRRFYDEATRERINKHLTDINDTITEEDIRNINTNITLESGKF